MFNAKSWLSLVVAFAAMPVRAADLNKYLPDDTEIVVSIDVTAVLESGLVRKHVPELLKKYGADLLQLGAQASGQKIDDDMLKALTRQLADAEAIRKWIDDNKKVVRRVIIGTSADYEDGNAFVVFEGKFDRARLKEMGKGLKPLGIVIRTMKDGKHEFFGIKVPGDEDEMFVALADDENIICCQDSKGLVKALERTDRKGSAVRKELIEVANRIDPKAGLWMAAAPKEADEYVNAFGSIVVTDGIRIVAAITSKDADGARNTASDLRESLKEVVAELDEAKKLFPPLGAVRNELKKVEPKAEKNVVSVEIELSGATLDKLIKDLPAIK